MRFIRHKVTVMFRRKPPSNASGGSTESEYVDGRRASDGLDERLTAPEPITKRAPPRALAGATTLQILPSLNDDSSVRGALTISGALLRAGARSLIASDAGSLVNEFEAQGSEWIAFSNAHVNRWNLLRAADALESIINTERVDIVHASGAGGAATALAVCQRIPLRMMTSLPDELTRRTWFDNQSLEPLTRGERTIVPSGFMAAALIKQYNLPRGRVVVIPPIIDTARLDPANARANYTNKLRGLWRVRSGERVCLAPGPVLSSSGHVTFVDAVRVLVNGGLRHLVFVVPRDDQDDPKQMRLVAQRTATQGVEGLFRFSDLPPDRSTLFCAADLVVVPAIESAVHAPHVVAEAQALARPTIASAIGVLPERLLAPPRVANAQRTGWLVTPGDPVSLAHAISDVLALDGAALSALSGRARQFAEATFSPQSVAAATLAVYTSVLGGG
jgi:glycosyltransferase involved in cell wall biosynthesis